MEDKETQIKDTTAFLMIFTALCFDGIQALIGWIPFVGNALADMMSIFIFLTFFLWFYMNGIKMVTPKRLGSLGGGGVIEMIPFINILPAWTLVVVYLIGTTKLKELAAKNPTLAKGAMAVGGKIKKMNKTGEPPHVPGVDEKKKDGNAQPEDKTQGKTPESTNQNTNPEKLPNKGTKTDPQLEAERTARTGEPIAKPQDKNKPIDISRGAQERRNLEESARRNRPAVTNSEVAEVLNRGGTIDNTKNAQQARNLERAREINSRIIDVSPGAQERKNLENSLRNNPDNKNKIKSMEINDELLELNSQPNLDQYDKERLQRAHKIMTSGHIEDKEKSDPVLLRAWERANRGEVVYDGSPEKMNGFSFSNIQTINSTNTAAGHDFASLNPQYGDNGKK